MKYTFVIYLEYVTYEAIITLYFLSPNFLIL